MHETARVHSGARRCDSLSQIKSIPLLALYLYSVRMGVAVRRVTTGGDFIVFEQPYGANAMSKKAAEHHRKAAEHLTHAARHHGEAAKHHEAGSHEKAAHHAHTARAHIIHGRGHAEEAVKAHAEEHGKK